MPRIAVTVGAGYNHDLPSVRQPRGPILENAMGEPFPSEPTSAQAQQSRLDSWKEIASYLNRDVTTVQRWEKREGMPVHRHLHDKRGSVYALSSELDSWRQNRRRNLEEEEDALNAEGRGNEEDHHEVKPASSVRIWFVVATLVLLALFAVAYIAIRNRAREAVRPKITSLAVLPLKNLSGDASQDYLADGMTEELIGRLSAIRGLRVISRTSTFHFKDTQLSVPEIANVLHVDAVVEGSVIREGSHVRVHCQLIRAATDEHFWSETYDRDMGDALALESEVARAIAAKVEVTASGKKRMTLVATRHIAPEVYESYLKGASQLDKAYTREEIERSISYFDEAIRTDATFAPAYVGLADAYDNLATIAIGGSPTQLRPKIVAAARKALELDPGLSEAHVLLADIHQKEWEWAEAESEYKLALDLKPNDPGAHQGYASWLMCQGRMNEALAWSQRARDLDPVGVKGISHGWILFQAHRFDEAIQELRSVLAVYPDDEDAYWTLGFALIGAGRSQEAILVLEKTVAMTHRNPGSLELLAVAYAHAARRAEALKLVDELKRRRENGYMPAGIFINPTLALGEYDEAFVWFERAYQEKSNILQFVRVHPFFDPVREDSRFKDLVHRVGLDKEY